MVRSRSIERRRSIRLKKRRPFYKKGIFYFLCIAGMCFYALWLWNRIYLSPHRFYFITLLQNGEIKKLLNGEKINLCPTDKLRFLKISTSIPFNIHVRLFCKDVDIEAFLYEEKSLLSFLPRTDIFRLYKLPVHIKFKNQDIGLITLIVKPTFEQWLTRFNTLKDLDKKRDFLNKGFFLFPEHEDELIEIRLQLAQEYEKKGMLKKAINEYLWLLGKSEKLEKDTLISLYEILAHLFTEIKRYKDAIRYYELAIKSGDKNPQVFYNIHELYNRIGDKKRASYYLAKLLELKPKDLNFRIELAKTLIEEGQIDKAEIHIEKALSINPDSIDALFLKAKILDKRGNKKELVEVYREILKIQPENETVLFNLAVLEYELQDIDSALVYITRYIKKRPNDKDAHELLFQIYRAKKMDSLAYKEAKILTELSPRSTYPYYFIFTYLWPKGRCKEILPYMIKGIRYNPKNITLRKYIVLCYLYQGKDALAIKQIRYILNLRPDDVSTLLQLAKLMEKRGDYKEALKIYKQIIKVDPENEEAQSGYLRLRFKVMEQKEGIE